MTSEDDGSYPSASSLTQDKEEDEEPFELNSNKTNKRESNNNKQNPQQELPTEGEDMKVQLQTLTELLSKMHVQQEAQQREQERQRKLIEVVLRSNLQLNKFETRLPGSESDKGKGCTEGEDLNNRRTYPHDIWPPRIGNLTGETNFMCHSRIPQTYGSKFNGQNPIEWISVMEFEFKQWKVPEEERYCIWKLRSSTGGTSTKVTTSPPGKALSSSCPHGMVTPKNMRVCTSIPDVDLSSTFVALLPEGMRAFWLSKMKPGDRYRHTVAICRDYERAQHQWMQRSCARSSAASTRDPSSGARKQQQKQQRDTNGRPSTKTPSSTADRQAGFHLIDCNELAAEETTDTNSCWPEEQESHKSKGKNKNTSKNIAADKGQLEKQDTAVASKGEQRGDPDKLQDSVETCPSPPAEDWKLDGAESAQPMNLYCSTDGHRYLTGQMHSRKEDEDHNLLGDSATDAIPQENNTTENDLSLDPSGAEGQQLQADSLPAARGNKRKYAQEAVLQQGIYHGDYPLEEDKAGIRKLLTKWLGPKAAAAFWRGCDNYMKKSKNANASDAKNPNAIEVRQDKAQEHCTVSWSSRQQPIARVKGEENNNTGSTGEPVRVKADFHPLAFLKLSVRGKPVVALLDTGCTHVLISSDLADELQLKKLPMEKPIKMLLGNGGEMEMKEMTSEEAHEQLERVLKERSRKEAEAMVRPSPKRYKNFKTAASRAHARKLAILAREQAEGRLTVYMWKEGKLKNEVNETSAVQGESGEAPREDKFLVIPKELSFQAQSEYVPSYEKFDALVRESGNSMPEGFLKMLLTYRDIFPDSLPPGLPARRIIDHKIPTVPDKLPPKGPIYQMDNRMKLAMKTELGKLAAKGYITITSSPYAAPCMLVPRKSDKPGDPEQFRLVINYQELNKISVSSEQPIPNITTIMEQLQGARYFTIMDMESGFHQVRVAPEDQHKTSFRCYLGHFEFKVMPFGLKGAPGTFQSIMTHILWEHVGIRCAVYLDDVLVYSPTLEKHVEDVAKVLKALRAHKMFPKITKCKFAQTELTYLGYTVGASGIKPSMDKVKDIVHWPEKLDSVTQVLQFLGLVGFVRMFMGTRFADMAKPLIDLTKKKVPFIWEEKHTKAIQLLKKRLINYTLLQLPDPAKPYVLWTDASQYSLGAVLLQDGKPLGFLSKEMNDQQQRYSTYQQELLALLTALKKWEHLLRPGQVTVYTDHSTLQHILQPKNSALPSRMVLRWLSFLAEFPGLTITYKPGKDNVVADALSRNPLHQPATPPCSSSLQPTFSACAILATLEARATRSGRRVKPSRRVADPLADPLLYALDDVVCEPSADKLQVVDKPTVANSGPAARPATPVILRELAIEPDPARQHDADSGSLDAREAETDSGDALTGVHKNGGEQQQKAIQVHSLSQDQGQSQNISTAVTLGGEEKQLPDDAHLFLPVALSGFWGETQTRETWDAADLERAIHGPVVCAGTEAWLKSLRVPSVRRSSPTRGGSGGRSHFCSSQIP
ncbi:hypothetical protein Emed_007225 [Eimeria media]